MDAFEAVSLPDLLSRGRKKYFSLCEANRSLVLVRRIVADIVRDYRQLCELHAACRTFDSSGNVTQAEEIRRKYASVTDHLSELQEELEKVGCEVKDYRMGLVDFPALLNRKREIRLCWQLGEERIACWHEPDAGYADRRPIMADFC
jgi:hypothetical protein